MRSRAFVRLPLFETMYNPTTLRTAFSGVVGLLQSNLPQVPRISAPLTTSTSGIYAQDKHPLVSLENIYYSAPDFGVNNYSVWISNHAYLLGEAVSDSGVLYSAKANVTSITPPHSDAANWQLFYPFQTWLQQKYNQAITNYFAEVIKLFKLQDSVKALIERQQLFRGNGSLSNSIVGDGSFVGFEILPQQAEGLLIQIDQIGFQFLEDQPLTVYLYHSAFKSASIKTMSIQTGGSSSFFWRDVVDFIMMYMVENTQGTYIVGYFQSDLTPTNAAISQMWDCSKSPCAGCDGVDLLMYNRWSRYTAFRNVKVPVSGINGTQLPDLSKSVFTSNTNWGLNFSLTVRCDLTNFITYSKYQYADPIAMQLCLEFLKTLAHSTRINPDMAQVKLLARAELNVNEKSTFINQYRDSVRGTKMDMSGFSSSCQPCDKSDGRKSAKWRTA